MVVKAKYFTFLKLDHKLQLHGKFHTFQGNSY